MRLKKLKLENFRNHGSFELDFTGSDNITCLVGPNASGKTNILEAIYILALIKSFRGQGAEDLIGWGGSYCRVTGEIEDGGTIETMEAFFGTPPNPRQSFKINGVKKGAADFIGNCRVVLFHPEDLNMLYLGPDLRRRYLDMLNIQANRKYYRAISSYKRILKQRNALLKAINESYAPEKDLDVWDGQLAANGAILISERAKTVDFLNTRLAEHYRRISGGDEIAAVVYRASAAGVIPWSSTTGIPAPENTNPGNREETVIENEFLDALRAVRKNDLRAEVTTIGPHRDELEFTLNGRSLQSHASRGEYRSILLSMKLLEIEYLRSHGGGDPILLLDDVFSELDPERQKQLTEAIGNAQTIITASHPDDNIIARTHRSLVQVKSSGQAQSDTYAGKA
jgi:DNA replication and repair protein RecF